MQATKDEELVKTVLAGNVRAFDTLVERYFGMVYVMAYARLGHKETAEDLAQEVFLRAYLYLGNLDQPRYFSAWISRIARNLASDWLRRGQRASRLIPMVPVADLPADIADTQAKELREKMESEEQDKSVHDAIMKLPPELREVVILHFAEGVSKADIARLLGVHPATVGRYLAKALKTMRGILEPVLRQSAPTMRAPRKATIRTIALVGAAAALSVKTKAALAAAAGGVTELSSVSLAKSGGVAAISAILGFLKAIPATIATGGKIMGIGKAIAIGTTSVAIAVGGTYYYYHQQRPSKSAPVKEQEISSPVAPTAPEPTESYAQEVRQVFLRYQQICRDNDIDGIMKMYDLELIAKGFEAMGWDAAQVESKLRESDMIRPEKLKVIASLQIESMALDTTQAEMGKKKFNIEIEGPVMLVRSGNWGFYFHKTPDGWKLCSQEEVMHYGDMQKDQEPSETPAALSKPAPESTESYIQEARNAFLNYQQLCRNQDIDGIMKAYDLELIEKASEAMGWDPSQMETRLRESLMKYPAVLKVIANLPIESITVDTTQAEVVKKQLDIIIEEPVMAVKSGKWTWHFHRTATGWKIVSGGYSGDLEKDLGLKEASSALPKPEPESENAYIQEVRKRFLNYLQLWKAGDIEGIMKMWDLEVIAKSNELDIQTAKESLRQRLEQEVSEGDNLTILENVKIGSIKAVDKTKFDIDGPIMAVQAELGPGRVCELYFHKTADGWKLIGQHPAGSER